MLLLLLLRLLMLLLLRLLMLLLLLRLLMLLLLLLRLLMLLLLLLMVLLLLLMVLLLLLLMVLLMSKSATIGILGFLQQLIDHMLLELWTSAQALEIVMLVLGHTLLERHGMLELPKLSRTERPRCFQLNATVHCCRTFEDTRCLLLKQTLIWARASKHILVII